jgi:hypothetical protein
MDQVTRLKKRLQAAEPRAELLKCTPALHQLYGRPAAQLAIQRSSFLLCNRPCLLGVRESGHGKFNARELDRRR